MENIKDLRQFFSERQLLFKRDVELYHDMSNFGHSAVVNFETYGPTTLRPDFKIETTDALVFGSIVDTLLTRPTMFDDEFIVNPDVQLTPSDKKLLSHVRATGVNYVNNLLDAIYDNDLNTLKELLDAADYYTTRKIETRLESVKNIIPCIRAQLTNKTMITEDQLKDAVNCIEAVHNSEITSFLFNKPENVFYQVKLCAAGESYDGLNINYKGLFDIIYLDEETKTIHPIDLKTTSKPERDFISNSFYKYKYYRQAEIYMKLLNEALYGRFLDWKIGNFKFLVVNKETLTPLLYEFPVTYVNGELKITDTKTVRPFQKVVAEMTWHRRNGQYMYSKDIYLELFKRHHKQSQIISIPIFKETKDVETNNNEEDTIFS